MGWQMRALVVATVILLLCATASAQIKPSLVLNDGFENKGIQASSCSLSDIAGKYEVMCNGIVTMPAFAAPAPFATPTGAVTFGYTGMGIAVTDAGGYVRAPNSCINVGGNLMLAGLEGQVQLSPSCTGTVRYYPYGMPRAMQGPDNWVLYIRFIVMRGGREIDGMVLGQQNCDASGCTPAAPAPVQCVLRLIDRTTPVQVQNPNFCSVP